MNSIAASPYIVPKNSAANDFFEISDPSKLPLEPVVSVLMLAYKHEPYLSAAIEGVLLQKTDFPIELVIAEDCSPDKTGAIAISYQKRYPELVRIITSQKNVGMNANFRRAFDACRGEFIALCEGDDYWIDSDKLKIQVSSLNNKEAPDLCAHPCFTLSKRKEQADHFSPGCVHSTRKKVLDLEEVIIGDGGFVPSASLFLRRTALIDMPDEIYLKAPVLDYFVQIFTARKKGMLYIPRIMSVYRANSTGSWSESMNSEENFMRFESEFMQSVANFDKYLPNSRDSIEKFLFLRALNGLGRYHAYGGNMAASFYRTKLQELATKKKYGGLWLILANARMGAKLWRSYSYASGIKSRILQRIFAKIILSRTNKEKHNED